LIRTDAEYNSVNFADHRAQQIHVVDLKR